jgi:A/G-specific adenine glycosylase
VAGEHGGTFPDDEEGLRKLPGIGAYTAAAIAAIAFGRRAVVVDGNVERVISRLHAIETPLPRSRPLIREFTDAMTPDEGAGDFAQAMMDLGATICTPRNPACGLCPVRGWCKAYAEGTPDRYPVKAPKSVRPHREGVAYWLEHGDDLLLVRRPPRGLLGGMLAFPEDAPASADWEAAGSVEHVFTHFSLTMTLMCARTDARPDGLWHRADTIMEAGLPTLFARLAARGLAWREKGKPAPDVRRDSLLV